MDVSSVLIGACIQGIGSQIDVSFSQSHPVVLGQHVSVANILQEENTHWDQSLTVEIHYTIENMSVDCELLLLFTEDSIAKLNLRIDYLLD